MPNAATTPTAPTTVPTPGVALAAARVPGSPTLPDGDPVALASVIARMANELFATPVVPAQGAISPSPPAQPSGLPDTPASTPSTPVVSSPFSAAPSFDGLASTPFSTSSDGVFVEVMRFPLRETTIEEAPVDPAPPSMSFPASYQIDPNGGPPLGSTGGTAFDAHAIRREFPILQERVNGKRLVWLDNAATTQKPEAVIARLTKYYEHENSNVHRAAHTLAARATDAYEGARETVRRFLNAPSVREIVFVRGATEGINLVAQSWGRRNVQAGDEIVITHLEHHANIVPWQMLCSEKGAKLRVAPVDDRGQVILDEYEKLLGPKTRLVAITQVSNALGTVTPTREMVEIAHRYGARALVDGAQAVSHMRVDVQLLDCDFYVFSGHKVFAPMGIGVVFGKGQLLDTMPPWQGGGNMIEDVTFERTTYQPAPARFEAGTGSIGDAVGLGTALDWLSRVGLENVSRHEHDLLVYATERLLAIPGVSIIGTAPDKAGVISFVLAGHDPQDVAAALDKEGIAVRGGHHCAQPILRRFGREATVRASFAPYNVREDVDALVAAVRRLQASGPSASSHSDGSC
ncbi:MAG: family 2A encapsulin nanocompartment cargo protein cysteine desulfurase [Polyangia bacterium]